MSNLQAQIIFKGGIAVPVECEVETLGDVAKLGGRIIAAARGAGRLMPVLKDTPVESITIGAAPRRAHPSKGRTTKPHAAAASA